MPRPSRSTGGHWRSGRKLGGRRIRRRLPLLAAWGSFTAPRANMPRPSRSTGGHWRSGRKLGGRRTRRRPPLLLVWGSFTTQGKYAEAEPLFKRALAVKEKKLGPEHLLDVAISL